MRPILALAILLLGLKAAAAEAKYQDFLHFAGEHPFTSSLEFDVTIGGPDLKIVVAVPSEPSDTPHDQGEAATEPPQSPAPATTDADAKKEAPHSVGELCHALLASAEDNGLPVPFFANLIWQESRLKLDSVSRVGALGIAQFMPKVAREVGLDNPFDPRQAIPASARFLNALRQHFGNLGFVAAAYNAGTHRVAEWLDRQRALPRETQTYVVRVTGRSAEAWRKSPVHDSQLTFVRRLPCRELPAFADLEQARLREAELVEEAQPQPQQEKIAAKVVQTSTEKVAGKVAQKAVEKVTTRVARSTAAKIAGKVTPKIVEKAASGVAQKAEKKAPLEHRPAPEAKVAGAAAAGKVARNVPGGKHEATRRPHVTHEKRRVASRSTS
jgi:hypothetical protein